MRKKGGGIGADYLSFVFVNTHTRCSGEGINKREAGDERFDPG